MLTSEIFSITSAVQFHETALKVFRYQYDNVRMYRSFCQHLNVTPSRVTKVEDIPFLPIQFFKSDVIISEEKEPEAIFKSSKTTGSVTSKHHVAQLSIYEESFTKGFENVYGALDNITILALLPSYHEQGNSSLIYMINSLIKKTNNPNSGFYLDNTQALIQQMERLERNKQKTLLIGVSYALLDLIEKHSFTLKHTTIMETGGMKGRRKELVKSELHEILQQGFGVSQIHSEYGMTELLSQAYLTKDEHFFCPPWMRVLTRDPNDALTLVELKTGGINVIDLANIYSCSFIATQDLGKVYSNGSFEILGRFDTSDIRGCNLMVF